MKKIKTFFVWLIFGYDNRLINTYLEYCENNLNMLGVREIDNDIYDFQLSELNGSLESESFKVVDVGGKIILKPSIDTKIFYKVMFMVPLIFGFVLDKFGWLWAIQVFIIMNFCTLILQFKNFQILQIKINQIRNQKNISEYFDSLRLKLAIERLYNFKKRTLTDLEKYIQKQDILFVKQINDDKQFSRSSYSEFINDLELLTNDLDLGLTKYEDILECMNNHLKYYFFGKKWEFDIIQKKIYYSLQKELSFFEDYKKSARIFE